MDAGKLQDALKEVAEAVGGRYVQELISDFDETQIWHIGIATDDPHEDIDIRTDYPTLYSSAIRPDKKYTILGVGNCFWEDYHPSKPEFYNSERIIKAVTVVKEDLERLLNI